MMARHKNKDADARITIDGKEYALFKSGPLSQYPYMVDLSTGKIPYQEQRPLLKSFLLQHGIEIDSATTHTYKCIRKAVDLVKEKEIGV